MEIQVCRERISSRHDEIIVAGIFEKSRSLTGAAEEINACTAGMIRELVRRGDFTGRLYQVMPLYPRQALRAKRVLLVGLGKEKEFTLERLRGACATAARYVRDMGLKSFTLPLAFVQHPSCPLQQKLRACVEGVKLGLYRFREFKTKGNDNGKREPAACTVLVNSALELRPAQQAVKKAVLLADAACMARDLVNHPGNSATPGFLADRAKALAKKSGLACTVLDRSGAQKLGMGAFLAVARGSDEPPRFIVLEYKPRVKKTSPPIVLIGKAITFDSGGISLKPAQDMDEMKTDMAGGAAVLGALQACAGLQLPVHVVGLIPATENLPSGHALKPGDIITSMSGTTIEIISTDAEGRLILADALAYARRYKPAAIIDCATLTGACIIALGNEASGVMGTDEKLVRKIRDAGEATGERAWPLPLWQEYGELVKSDVADIKNAGGRPAGAITAGYFLKEFAGKTPWAHIDIAGTAWTKKAKPYIPKGATGVGVRLLVEVLEKWNKA